jgi:hypothetical protein
VRSIGALLVATTLVSCTGGDSDDAATTTTAPPPVTTTIPTYDLTSLAPGALGDLAECDGAVATLLGLEEADVSLEHEGDEVIASVDCEGTELDRVLLFSGTNNNAELLSEPIVGSDPQTIGTDPVRILAFQLDGERALQTVYRWDSDRLRAMSETILTLDDYLAAIGSPVELAEPLSRADLFDRASPAVVSLEGVACSAATLDAGTGFIVGPDLVVTAAHVVEDFESMVVTMIDGEERLGQTIGYAPGQDAALIRLTESVDIEPLTWSEQTPRVGFDISVLGYPLNLDLSVTAGTISGVGRTILFPNGEQIPNVMQTDALTNPGNSGGPWLDETGRVIGLHIAGRDGAAGINWGVAAEVVRALVEQWTVEPQPYQPCTPPEAFLVRSEATGGDVDELVELFSDYAGGITSGDFDTAYERLWQPTVPVTTWAADLATSTWSDVTITSVTNAPADRVEEYDIGEVNSWEVRVSATTNQAPRFGPDGQECTDWELVYLVASIDGVFWQIVSSGGSTFTAC